MFLLYTDIYRWDTCLPIERLAYIHSFIHTYKHNTYIHTNQEYNSTHLTSINFKIPNFIELVRRTQDCCDNKGQC